MPTALNLDQFRSAFRAGGLRSISVRVEIDTSAWSPAQAEVEGRKRPDTSERQRRAHQAAVHDAWFRQEVERAVQEADGQNAEWDSQAEVKRQSAIKRAAWRSKSISSVKANA